MQWDRTEESDGKPEASNRDLIVYYHVTYFKPVSTINESSSRKFAYSQI